MSWSELSVQGHRRRTDCAIHRACAQLATDPSDFNTFQELLLCARQRAPRLFEAPVAGGRHPGVDALVNLCRFRGEHLRAVTEWKGTTTSWRTAVASLAQHLVCRYPMPAFLASAWYAADACGDTKRWWFIAHSRGASFRSLNLPIAMTRKMEHIFLASQEHLPIEHAMRQAELLALGAPAEVTKAVMATRLATDLRHGEFWRTVWMFLIAHAGELDSAQIGPMVDYIQAVRHGEISMESQVEGVGFNAPEPAFSMKGRTVPSMLRLMREWHGSLAGGSAAFSWTRSPYQPLLVEELREDRSELPRRWQLMELTDSAQLQREGAALHHCVGSYAYRCYQGASRVWSLRLWQAETVRSVLTIEVDPKRRAVVQVRGRANRMPSGKPLELLRDWAARERLQMAI